MQQPTPPQIARAIVRARKRKNMIQEGVSVCVITELVEASGAVEREVDRAVEQAAGGNEAEPRPDQQAAVADYERLVGRVARAGHRRFQARFLLIRLLSAAP